MDAFLTVRRDLATNQMGKMSEGLRSQIAHLEMELKADDEAVLAFQRENKIVLSKNDDESTRELSSLKNKLLLLRSQADSLDLQDPTTPAPPLPAGLLDKKSGAGSDAPAAAADRGRPQGPVEDNAAGDVRLAEQAVVKLQAEYDDFGRDLKPRHPKMLKLKSEID